MRTLRRRRGNRAQRRRFVWLWRKRSASLPGGVPAGASVTAIVLHNVLRAGLATANVTAPPGGAGGVPAGASVIAIVHVLRAGLDTANLSVLPASAAVALIIVLIRAFWGF